MPIRARIALALALSMASPAVTEMSAGRASVVDGDTLEVRAEGCGLTESMPQKAANSATT
jgi:hypothetical protein